MPASSLKQAIDHCQQALGRALENKQPLRLVGGGSKLGRLAERDGYQTLSLDAHCGVLDYQPSEQYVTALAGTSIADINQLVAASGQRLACAPPMLPGATLGGTIASAAAGSGALRCGRLRDAVLGLWIVNGLGEALHFGGTLVKNVAGFDLARLNCGAYGRLGVIAAATLRLVPQPSQNIALLGPRCSAAEALPQLTQLADMPELRAALWHQERLVVWLEGHLPGALANWPQAHASAWEGLEQQKFGEMIDSRYLVLRCTCPADAPFDLLPGHTPFALDWFGRVRWYRLPTQAWLYLLAQGTPVQLAANGISLLRFNFPYMQLNRVLSLQAPLAGLYTRLFDAFDPHRLCNPDLTWHANS